MNESCGCASTNPIEDVFAMQPPSPDAESLRDQQSAQVRAPDGFFVTANEAGHLEGRQQPVRQSAVRWRVAGRVGRVRSMRRFRNGDRFHGSSSAHWRRRTGAFDAGLLGDVASRSVPNRVSGLLPITTFGWLGGRVRAGRSPRLWLAPGATLDARRMYATRERRRHW
jgi:hypothetical protein